MLPYLEPYLTVHALDRRGRGATGDAPEYRLERGIRTSPLWWIPWQRRQATGECVRAFAWWHRCFRRRSHDHERPQTRPLRGLAGPGPFIYALPAGVVTRMNKLLAEGDRDGVVEALFQSVEEISDEDMAALRSAPSIGNLIELF